ncbi:MAG: tetratricopeptide repeat protein [Phycisphaeraceae bacterium]
MNRICLPMVAAILLTSSFAFAQPAKKADAKAAPGAAAAPRGSIVEDQAARKLIEAGETRYDADEFQKAVDIWQSTIERYPRSKYRYLAHMKLGNHFLNRDRAFDQARKHFEIAAGEENTDEDQRAEATLKMGICFYQARNFGKTFAIMREVIETFPVSAQVNQAYYYIGLAHFQQGHYSRAITALERVGTALTANDAAFEKVEAGKRLFVRIEDADLAALTQGETVKVKLKASSGDEETLECIPVGRNVRVVMGSMLTQLGKAKPGNNRLEVKGDDTVKVTYIDSHTADKQFDRPVLRDITVVGNAVVAIMDGAYSDTLKGVVLGKEVNLQVIDADLDLTDDADKLQAYAEVHREKLPEEIEKEIADLKIKGELGDGEEAKIERYRVVDRVKVTLTEVKIARVEATSPSAPSAPGAPGAPETEPAAGPGPSGPGAAPAPAPAIEPAAQPTVPKNKNEPSDFASEIEVKETVDNTIHSGVFRAQAQLVSAESPILDDDKLQALPSDQVRLVYMDESNTTADPVQVVAKAKTVEGNLGGVRVTRTEISDRELKLRTQLRTASALCNIGNRYKEFGIKAKATEKYNEGLLVCEDIMAEARKLGGRILEETYVQLWQIYYEMDKLELAAAMCQRLAREFPESAFVDDALLQLAAVSRRQGQHNRAIGIYSRLVDMKTSQLRGEAQFGIAECYEEMAKAAKDQQAAALYDRAFQEYKKVFEQFPDSGRVGEAVAKMANFYYQKQDYTRAIDVFETVLGEHPDAKYLDVILFNYGRCLYRMDRRKEARAKFDQLIGEFPESALAPEAKRVVEALAKAGF